MAKPTGRPASEYLPWIVSDIKTLMDPAGKVEVIYTTGAGVAISLELKKAVELVTTVADKQILLNPAGSFFSITYTSFTLLSPNPIRGGEKVVRIFVYALTDYIKKDNGYARHPDSEIRDLIISYAGLLVTRPWRYLVG